MSRRAIAALFACVLCACGPIPVALPMPVADAGSVVDAGATVDAGAVIDAGTVIDAGVTVDAGTIVDAGTAFDAGTVVDAGSVADAGSVVDAGIAPTGPSLALGVSFDLSVTFDAGDIAGPRQLSGWTTVIGTQGSAHLRDSTGQLSPVRATWSAPSFGETTILTGTQPGDEKLMARGLSVAVDAGVATVTFTGLDQAYPLGYRALVFVGRGGGDAMIYPRFSMSLSSPSVDGGVLITGQAMRSFYGRYDDLLGNGDMGNFYESAQLSGGQLTLSFTALETTVGLNGVSFSPACPAGLADCNRSDADGCEANVTADRDRCGACFSSSCAFDQVCKASMCSCQTGQTLCMGTCASLSNDTANCGQCGTTCMSGELCIGGACQAAVSCSPGSTVCSGACVTLGNDSNHCGSCGTRCTGSTQCVAGSCQLVGGPIGCSDGARDAFTNLTTFPNIAGCSGGWTVPGIFPAPLRTTDGGVCGTSGDDDSANAPGTGCSSADLCATGWHLCRGDEIQSRTNNQGCAAETFAPSSFYAASISGTGCLECALPNNAFVAGCGPLTCSQSCQEAANLNNDIFGCGAQGSLLTGPQTTRCGGLNRSGFNNCASLTTGGWNCGGDQMESVTLTRVPTAGVPGGVLCCK